MTTVYATMDAEGYIVEHDGALKTGPFKSWQRAVDWYREELDVALDQSMTAMTKETSVLHAHTCIDCKRLCTCSVVPCPYRASDKEKEWVCYRCEEERAEESLRDA